jgi:ribosomal-protein-alanine N-acetyltransferase
MTVRLACPSDAEAIARLESLCFSDARGRDAVNEQLALPYALTLVAIEEEHAVGYLTGIVLAPECEIHRVATDPAYRRRGIGAALVAEALSQMKALGAETAYLEVRVSNGAAGALYSAAGFASAGIRKNYYRRPTEDAAILVRNL